MSIKNQYGLIGKKLLHAFSQKYFLEKFNHAQLSDYSYELWEIETLEDIRTFIFNKKNVRGFNVTIPYKEAIIKYLDDVSEEVIQIRACNCVHIKDNRWIGYNTDWWGFLKMIENKLESHHNAAMILGTGGSAKAVAYALKKLKLPFIWVSRDANKDLNTKCIAYEFLDKIHFEKYSVVVNTTPLGMYPAVNIMPEIPINFIDRKNFVIDLIYNPEKTLLLQKAEERGARILSGREMLYLQAEKSWYIWQEINK